MAFNQYVLSGSKQSLLPRHEITRFTSSTADVDLLQNPTPAWPVQNQLSPPFLSAFGNTNNSQRVSSPDRLRHRNHGNIASGIAVVYSDSSFHPRRRSNQRHCLSNLYCALPNFLSIGLEADNILSKPAFPPLSDHPQVVGASLIVHASAKTPYSLKVSQCVLYLNAVKTKSPVPLLSHLSALSRLY